MSFIIAQLYVHSCRAFRANVESVHGPYLGPVNKYFIINILTCAFVSVHHRRSSAWRATPLQGVAQSLWHKTGAQCGAYGWWQKHNISKQQVSHPMADHKVVQKVISFLQNNSSDHITFTRQPTGWLQQCAAPSQGAQKTIQQCATLTQGAQRTMPRAWGLCPADIGGHWWWCWGTGLVLSEGIQPWEWGSPFIPVPEVQTPKDGGCDWWQRKWKWGHTVQWTFCGARGTELYWDATGIELYL